ncbi:probable inactive purple acid phosphatase 1 isoform X2 [Helianthus annuus]|uniref:probable inactive purple acid phosphatase 1 isoform X2 n=1 Tax=Helianthus annuus TaxID=4232 RepID=UPI001652ECE7|nr:probable inactive purple acid phosphatase 1 isoform X2 [Helianthus annuus]
MNRSKFTCKNREKIRLKEFLQKSYMYSTSFDFMALQLWPYDRSQPFIIHMVYFTNFSLTFAHLCSHFIYALQQVNVGGFSLLVVLWSLISLQSVVSHPFARIAIDKTVLAVSDAAAFVEGQSSEWVNVNISNPHPTDVNDWIGVFSPSNFSASTCAAENPRVVSPLLCTAPIKYKYVRYGNPNYKYTGKAILKLQLINQRSDFSFALFTGGLSKPKLITVSNTIAFANPKSPNYPRLAQGKLWNVTTVTWTSGYSIRESEPFVEWGKQGEKQRRSTAKTLTFNRNSMCGAPAKTVGWRDPGYFHTSFLTGLWPNSLYTYKLGHKLSNNTVIWSQVYEFKSSPYPGQSSLQRVIIFGDMGKDEADGSNEYNQFQRGSLNTTRQLVEDLKNIELVFHIGDLSYANGYLSQWDQFTSQIEPIASYAPYMIASGNHERDWPNSGSFYENYDSGGECGVVAETMFYVPSQNKTKLWYYVDYGMFRFCIADSENDWREGSEQYKFIEDCLSSVNRQKQPWLVFLAHRVLGYSSSLFYYIQGCAEPMARESLENLWRKYNVDIAIFGHAHNYERTCPIYQSKCMNNESKEYSGSLNGTIHVVAGGGGASLSEFAPINTTWSVFRDYDYGFLKLTAFNHSKLLFEYKKSRDGKVYDSFTISRGS